MNKVISGLEKVVKACRGGMTAEAERALKEALAAAREKKTDSLSGTSQKIDALEKELETWLSKFSVIFAEPIGRSGMAKHAEHWIETLKK